MRGLLADRLSAAVSRFPSKDAIVIGSRRTSYAELGRQIGSVATSLRERVGSGGRVALLMENSPEYVAACYGAWVSGGVLVGLNPALKGEELERLVRHSGAQCLVVDRNHPESGFLRERVGSAVRILDVRIGDGFTAEAGPGTTGQLDPEAVAAIVYTSGTTGHPKGVMLTHGNLAANTESISQSLPIRAEDRALCVLPFQYSYGASVMHTHLAAGGTLVLERSFMYPHLVIEKMVEERVTTFSGVPSTFHLLLRRTDLSSYDLSSLRYMTVAGGPMSHGLISRLRGLVVGTDFFVMYGQTEASPRLTCLPSEDLDRKIGSAGKAIAGVELRIRGQDGEDLVPGTVGEVCARGSNVMLGYWNDQEESHQVLKDGWLWTGDLGHLDEEGYLFLKGRLREMIKSGAHRIAPAEIEEVIQAIPGVKEVVVTGIEDDLLGEAPKAWVIPIQADHALRMKILHECQSRLARFKVPKEVEFRTEFPRTASGKVRKHLLGSGMTA